MGELERADVIVRDEFYWRLVNWGRWCRSGCSGGRPIYSAEGRYVRERDVYNPDDPESFQQDRKPPAPPVDVPDAIRMFYATSPALGFPRVCYFLLSGYFIFRCRGVDLRAYMRRRHRINIPRHEIDAKLRAAIAEARARYERLR